MTDLSVGEQRQDGRLEWVERLIADPSTSFALRARLTQDATRDPVDVLNDAEMLLRVAEARLAVMHGKHFK